MNQKALLDKYPTFDEQGNRIDERAKPKTKRGRPTKTTDSDQQPKVREPEQSTISDMASTTEEEASSQ